MIIEIENTKGNTIGAVHLHENNIHGELEIIQVTGDVSVADCDGDYIFNTNEDLVRIQLNE